MSNNEASANSYQNENYTQRQVQSSFQPPTNIQLQQTMLPTTQQQFQSLHLTQQPQYYPAQIIPPLPLHMDMSMVQPPYTQLPPELQQQGIIYSGYPPVNPQQYHSHPMVNPQQQQQQTMRSDAPPFLPSSTNPTSNETKVTVNEPTSVTDNIETQSPSSFIYDLKKYKYDYFISKPTCEFDRDFAKFGSPTGICTLNDDRLLVANFDRDSLLLLDINGVVHQIYRDLPTPKDVLYYSSNPSQAVVATKKEVIILDLTTKQIVVRSKLRGFYPWNIQYIKDRDTFAACDPSGERIVFLDKNLAEIGNWSFNEQNREQPQQQPYLKIYPYAAYFLPDDSSLVLTHRENSCQLKEYDTPTGVQKKLFQSPPLLQSYSIYVDNARKCLIADKVNRRLVSIDKDSVVEEYKSKSIQEPYSMTFLSTGTLCVTDWNKSYGTNGGVVIISENDLKTNQ